MNQPASRQATNDQPADDQTAYGHDQDREPPKTAMAGRPEAVWSSAADRSPDDFDPDAEDGLDVNPSTGVEYGAVDNGPNVQPD